MIIGRIKPEGSAASLPGDSESQHDSSTLPVCVVIIQSLFCLEVPQRAHTALSFSDLRTSFIWAPQFAQRRASFLFARA
jgi:hypothetical protein